MTNDFIAMSTRSWHYKLIKYTLGSKTPRPENMTNLCPYFWILVFCILMGAPFLTLFKLIKFVVRYSIGLPFITSSNYMEKLEREFHETWDEEKAMHYYLHGFYDFKKRKPFGVNINPLDLKYNFRKWISENYGLNIDNPEDLEKYKSIIGEKLKKEIERLKELTKLKEEKENAKKIRREKVKNITREIKLAFEPFKKAFEFDLTNIIKYTKKVVGALITLLIFAISYVAACLLGGVVAWLVKIWDWNFVLNASLTVIGVATIVLVGIFLIYAVDHFKRVYEKYEMKETAAFTTNLIHFTLFLTEWMLVYPLKYFIYYPFVYFPFYLVIYKFVIKWLIVGTVKKIANAAFSFGGIFSDYFSASYKGYCPGIKWVDESENSK